MEQNETKEIVIKKMAVLPGAYSDSENRLNVVATAEGSRITFAIDGDYAYPEDIVKREIVLSIESLERIIAIAKEQQG